MPRRDDFDDDFLDPESEAYDYKPVSSDDTGGGKGIKIVVAISVIAAIGAGTWYFTGQTSDMGDDIPVVRADTAPIKEKPTDPGGMDVPNRDKTVYERVDGNTEPKLERLLPRPEKPLDKPVASLELPEPVETANKETGAPVVVAPMSENSSAIPLEPAPAPLVVEKPAVSHTDLPDEPSEEMAAEIAPPPPAPVVDENAPRALVKRSEVPSGPDQQDKDDLTAKIAQALKDSSASEPQTVAPAPKPEPKAEQQSDKPAPLKNGYVLQLLSSKSKSGVETSWEKIRSKNADLLKGYTGEIVKADLGDKGIYYRLRVGTLATGDQAKALCSQLKSRNVGCFIVKLR